MICFNILSISSDKTKINVSVQTDIDSVFTSLKFWNKNTFKDESKCIQLNSKFIQDSNKEVFTINTSDVNIEGDVFNGIFFLEFGICNSVDDCIDKKRLGVVVNLMEYYDCLLSKILEKNPCDTKVDDNILNINQTLEGVKLGLQLGYYDEVFNLIKSLDTLCKNNICISCKSACTKCNEFSNKTLINTTYINNELL